DASCEPVLQAEPAEQQIQCRSSDKSATDDSIASNDKLDVFGTRIAPAPFTDAPLTVSRTELSNRSRIARMVDSCASRYLAASSAAFPRPTIPATFSVPPRRAFSWPPPAING